jgi:Reverse transcriptase (RNA-dependent DNA polymerase)
LNDLDRHESFPLPRLDYTLVSIREATIFTTLDASRGFWQVPVDPKNRSKTAFATRLGVYEFLRVSFGLRNASSTFQRQIDIILSRVKWKTALVYLDDIIIFSASFEQHVQNVVDVLAILQSA